MNQKISCHSFLFKKLFNLTLVMPILGTVEAKFGLKIFSSTTTSSLASCFELNACLQALNIVGLIKL